MKKRIISALTALLIIFSLSLNAFAAGYTKKNITYSAGMTVKDADELYSLFLYADDKNLSEFSFWSEKKIYDEIMDHFGDNIYDMFGDFALSVSESSGNAGMVSVAFSGINGNGSSAPPAEVVDTSPSALEKQSRVPVEELEKRRGLVRIYESSLTLYVGEKNRVPLSYLPDGAKVTYTTTDKTVAAVTSTGIITAKKAGTATIKAKLSGKGVAGGTFSVKVTVKSNKVTSVSTAASLKKLLTSKTGGHYKLTKNISGLSAITVSGGTHVLDLNGYTISGTNDDQSLISVKSGSLKIKDSSAKYSGTIKNNGAQDAVGCTGGKLTVNGGILQGGAYGSYNDGGTVLLNGGTFVGEKQGIKQTGGKLTINYAQLFGVYGVGLQLDSENVTAEINGGTFSGKNALQVGYVLNNGKMNTKLTVNGGMFRSTYHTAAVIYCGNVVINDGVFYNDNSAGGAGLDLPLDAEVEINGGYFHGSMFGLSAKLNTDLRVTGGEFHGNNYCLYVAHSSTGKISYDKTLFYTIDDGSRAGMGITDTKFSRLKNFKFTDGMTVKSANQLYTLFMYAKENGIKQFKYKCSKKLMTLSEFYVTEWLDGAYTSYDLDVDEDAGAVSVKIKYSKLYETSQILKNPKNASKFSKEAQNYAKQIKNILSGVINSGMTDAQKVTAVSNYMVKTYAYDFTYKYHTFEEMLTKKKAVCQGYSELFKLFMDGAGIECEIVCGLFKANGSYAPHAWNTVTIGKKLYYVDVTNNDGFGSNIFLLKEPDAFFALGYHQ